MTLYLSDLKLKTSLSVYAINLFMSLWIQHFILTSSVDIEPVKLAILG